MALSVIQTNRLDLFVFYRYVGKFDWTMLPIVSVHVHYLYLPWDSRHSHYIIRVMVPKLLRTIIYLMLESVVTHRMLGGSVATARQPARLQ